MNLEKYKELFELSKDVFAEELSRSERIDNKAAKYLTALTFLLGVFAVFNKQILQSTIPPDNSLEWIIITVDILLLFFMVVAWFRIFSVFRIHQYAKIPIDIDFFDKNELIDIYYAMSKGLKSYNEQNKEKGDKKSKRLYHGYILIQIIVILLCIFSFLLVAKSWQEQTKKEDVKMSQSQNQGNNKSQNSNTHSSSSNSSSPKQTPNPKINPPAFQMVTESYDPSKLSQRKTDGKKTTNNT